MLHKGDFTAGASARRGLFCFRVFVGDGMVLAPVVRVLLVVEDCPAKSARNPAIGTFASLILVFILGLFLHRAFVLALSDCWTPLSQLSATFLSP